MTSASVGWDNDNQTARDGTGQADNDQVFMKGLKFHTMMLLC